MVFNATFNNISVICFLKVIKHEYLEKFYMQIKKSLTSWNQHYQDYNNLISILYIYIHKHVSFILCYMQVRVES